MKHIAEVSDQKFLLLQHIMHLLFMGTRLTKDEAAKLAISGDSLLCRARQIQWALTKRRAVDQINCSIGVKSAAGDDDGIKKTNCGFRCLGYFDEDLNAPASYPLSGLPTGRKTP